MIAAKRKLPRWVKRGLLGSVIVLASFVGLAVLQSLVPYDSPAYTVIHRMIWGIVAPVITPIENMGIHGCEAMAYIVPIFLFIALYLALIGFGIGSLTTWFVRSEKERTTTGPTVPPEAGASGVQ